MTKASLAKEEIILEDILQAAIQLFQKYGLNKVTMDDIAKAVGKGRSSLYYYYKNREEIFEAVMKAIIKEIVQEISTAVNKASLAGEKIQAFCWAKLKTSEQRHAFYRALETGMGVEEISRHTTAMMPYHLQLMEQESDLLREILGAAMESREINQITKKEMDMHIFVLRSSIRGIRREVSVDAGKQKELKNIIPALANMMLKGIS